METDSESDLSVSTERVKIPKALIERLKGLGPHFCLVKARDKDPSIGGKGWQKAENLMFADDPRLQAHLKRGGNYGVVGGFGLVTADADTPELRRIFEEKLPETFTVESPGSHGWHAYFLCGLEKPIRLRDKDGENVGDIQGPGKMVVGPGSIHPNGGIYKVVKDVPLAQVTAQELREALKDWVVPEKEIAQIEATARREKRETRIDLDILQVVPLAGLQKRGSEYFGPHPVHGSSTKQNFWVNPSKKCWHCFRHGSGGGPLLWIAVEEGIIDCSEAGPGILRGEIFKRTLEKAQERGFIKKDKLTLEKQKEKGQTELDMGYALTLLNEKFVFKCPTDTRELLGYNDGHYVPFECRVHEVLESEYGKELSSHFVEETSKHLQRANYVERSEINKFINKIPLQNGLFNFVTHDVEPFNPEEIYTYKLNVKYDPEAKSPIFLKFVNQILEPEDILLLQETMGYCLLPDMPYHKLFWWYGIGRNGKDRLVLTLEYILGKKNCSELSIGEFNEKRRFSLYQLYGKLLNVSSEPFLSKYGIQTNVLKMISGQNTINAELKGKTNEYNSLA